MEWSWWPSCSSSRTLLPEGVAMAKRNKQVRRADAQAAGRASRPVPARQPLEEQSFFARSCLRGGTTGFP